MKFENIQLDGMLRRVLPIVVVAVGCSSPGLACVQLGCDGDHSNKLAGLTPPAASSYKDPVITWDIDTDRLSARKTNNAESSQLLCASAADAGALVCTVDDDDASSSSLPPKSPTTSSARSTLFAIDVDSGNETWGSADISSTGAHPLLDEEALGGIAVASDGSFLAGFSLAGSALGPPTFVSNDRNGTFSLAATDNGVIMLVERAGVVSGYLTDGIVHASVRLTDTVAGEPGLFVPISPPLIVPSGNNASKATTDDNRNRVLMLTAFERLQDSPSKGKATSIRGATAADADHNDNDAVDSTCRVYAIDVARTISNRFSVAWHLDVACAYTADTGMCVRCAVLCCVLCVERVCVRGCGSCVSDDGGWD